MGRNDCMRILFQGDSITDAGRDRERPDHLGLGYPLFAAGRLGLEKPGAYTFVNRGVSGDRVVDLYARIKRDIIHEKPDYMSILVGVNDVIHENYWQNGVCASKFRKIYRMLLEELLEALPKTRILIMEPFVLPGSFTEEDYPGIRGEVVLRAKAAKELADEYKLPYMELQEDLDRLSRLAPPTYWLADGVHPTAFFHQYIADKWIELFHTITGA